MAPFASLGFALAAQRGGLFQWVPIALAIGIGGYFSLTSEPSPAHLLAAGVLLLMLAGVATRIAENWRPLATFACLMLLGLFLAMARTYSVAAPVLDYRYYGPIQGRIVHIDRSTSDAVRLTLDRVVLKNMAPARTPDRVRVSLHGEQGFITPEPGLTIILTGHLSPPSGPVEPGGFDFQRLAWFDRLGGVGYTRTPVLALYPAREGAAGLFLHRLRLRISTAVQIRIEGEPGAFAAAIMTGDRSGMSKSTLQALRASNLAHLLAISGLHMGLLTGFVFACLRYGLALAPALSMRLAAKKIAAVGALLAGAGYLALSGGNVATERAFVMVAVMFTAVLLDRRAVTLRAVAIAAVIILVFRPEVLPEPGFQMSFAATTALVAVFRGMQNWNGPQLPKLLRPVLAVVISSAVAGLATAPVAAAHFNRIADYGLVANLLSVPLMGAVVMPGAVLTACLAPLGLEGIGLAIMTPAIRWILGVAHWVSDLDGAISYVPAPPASVLPVMALGALWIILWRGGWRMRAVGTVPVALAFVLWAEVERPALLISDTGGLVGLMTVEGRALSKGKGEGFAAQSWLENDGDGVDQPTAYARPGMVDAGKTRVFDVGGQQFVHVTGRGADKLARAACADGQAAFVVLSGKLADAGPGPGCRVLDRDRLGDSGAVAVYAGRDGPRLVSAREVSGARLWNAAEVRAAYGLDARSPRRRPER